MACIIKIVFACVLHMELKKMGDNYNKSQFVELSKDQVSMK
ncbi:hypothetical protein HMPREF0574_0134 [Mobiluncus curtisii subsp. curtisii ATCC 35241]|nr:hypothetical protein HMPREF0574_0134 [Mobiluncus curtisii subsp. curtisii ATCC 35241]